MFEIANDKQGQCKVRGHVRAVQACLIRHNLRETGIVPPSLTLAR